MSTYWIFLGLFVACVSWCACCSGRPVVTKQLLLLLVSYLLYASLSGSLITVLIASSLLNFIFGVLLRSRNRAGMLWLGIGFNMMLLLFFKYLPGFAVESHIDNGWLSACRQIAMPVGISFWTFQGISYLLDLYGGEELSPSLLEFCLYMGFAPTVFMGPITRLHELLPQLRESPGPSWGDVRCGLERVWLGFFMCALSRLLATGAKRGAGLDAAFLQSPNLPSIDIWILSIGYALQVFLDFAGYCHIVIGAARAFGFQLPENFNKPYLSTTISQFWTRWHMSLSFWIRDYVFFPLAVLNKQVWWRYFCLWFCMVIFGVWHKASVFYVIWGAYQGALLVAHRLWQHGVERLNVRWEGTAAAAASWLVTFLACCLGCLFFRAEQTKDMDKLIVRATVKPLLSLPALPVELYGLILLVVVGYFGFVLLSQRFQKSNLVLSWMPLEVRFICGAVMFYLVVLHFVQLSSFIYFQF